MDGFECCRQLRQLPDAEVVPILMITVLDDADSVALAFEAGATDYITKPIYWAVLSQRVRRLLEGYKTARQARQARQHLERYQHWFSLQQQLLQTVQTQPLDQFLQTSLQVMQVGLMGDRAGDQVLLYQISSARWLTAGVSPDKIVDLNASLKIAPMTKEGLTWLQSQAKPIAINKLDASEAKEPSSDPVPAVNALQDSLQDLLQLLSVQQLQIWPIFNNTNLQALLIRGQNATPHSEIGIVGITSACEIMAIAFQISKR
jgi:CheY-like chemotaxis protein